MTAAAMWTDAQVMRLVMAERKLFQLGYGVLFERNGIVSVPLLIRSPDARLLEFDGLTEFEAFAAFTAGMAAAGELQ